MFARHGKVIVIPHNDITAERVMAELQAATGQQDLHQAFAVSAEDQGTTNKAQATQVTPVFLCVACFTE